MRVLCVCYVCTVQLGIGAKAFYSDLQYKGHVACVTHFGVFFDVFQSLHSQRGKL